ncbi:MAG TPA: hypothetical protein VE860_00005 [Chthoniobacterales bacterium]|jgi:hypothetical protein|nr:hypothetical protein [Chthoniobacterales bacterium]
MSRTVLILVTGCMFVILLSLREYRIEYRKFMQSIDQTVLGDDVESAAEMNLEAQGSPVRDNRSIFPVPDLTPPGDLAPTLSHSLAATPASTGR